MKVLVKPRPNETNTTYRNIVGSNMLCIFGHPAAKCCDVLGVVSSNLKMFKFFMQHLWMLHDARTCALVRFSILNMSQQVATGWPNVRKMLRPTILGYVAFKCCDRLAGAFKCWANNVGICCVEMLRSFGRGLYMKPAVSKRTKSCQ